MIVEGAMFISYLALEIKQESMRGKLLSISYCKINFFLILIIEITFLLT